ncbi:DEAD/DEAH box helicase [Belnapia sp. T6]|uniref:Transcription-repair-coupling factor n=1 Tax=Belnapia mucosa TaxID=2804532 RepID=A0ABS1V665_9PROT|nr:DEAD/DEAH box helicase [Belnapia mucosa]MBL6457173.1 DEAD/DEAH box helicase [Belnapia mucosa]
MPPGLIAEPEGLLAARLVEAMLAAGEAGLVLVTRSEGRAARLHRAARALAPDGTAVLLLPGWDCLPYDRVSPSRAVMGARMVLAAGLAEAGARLLIASAEAASQRLPRPPRGLRLALGDAPDPAALQRDLLRLGYLLDERVDEPGEAALHGEVVDLWPPAGKAAWRLRLEEGRIAGIQRFDIVTQRSTDEAAEALEIGPASEVVLAEDDPLLEARPPGLEHALTAHAEALMAPLDLLPAAAVLLDDGAEAALAQRRAEVAEAFRTRITLAPAGEQPLPPPDQLYLDEAAWDASLAGHEVGRIAAPDGPPALPPRFIEEEDPEDAFVAYAEAQREAGRRIAIAGGWGRGARRLARRLGEVVTATDWPALLAASPGSIALLPAEVPGFESEAAVVVPYATIRPSSEAGTDRGAAALFAASARLQPGDAVIHLDHGLGALEGVERVDTGEAQLDCLRLRYADATQIVPFDELDRIWRYGAEAEGLSLDRLGGEAWPKRRAEAEAAVAESARALLALVRARETARAPMLRPPTEEYTRLAARFPYELTEDQAAASTAVLGDLASGRPMDRLVCGDVGFGKTEVALRAAAAAAFSGKQVALLAPTTVLVRQHLESFRRRFEGFGLRIEALSRLTPPGEARAIKAALARGEVAIAIGTQALAARGIRFRDLGLLIVDEEQRFGAAQKEQLKRLGHAEGMHMLTLTATPIPRTLQAALVGLRELSVIATPPARRQPVRTLRAPIEDALLAGALRREARRGGQSFCVCPRIEDIAPMRERLAALVPDLTLIEAHGGMPAADVDAAMVRFAEGEGDVLLSTNIVEAGLDVPRANTMLVCRADRFGLAQLHQLRGRVGRGRVRGVIYLLTDPQARIGAATDRRLAMLEALDRVGAGFAISARDLDLRGAGDLLGEEQAGHLKLVGLELYRHLLDRALAMARGKAPPEAWSPGLAIGVDAYVPEEHVPEEALRVGLHGRLAGILRAGDAAAVEALEDEIEDRFGPAPAPLANLFALARIAARCRRFGIERLEVGPNAAAATPRGPGKRLLLRRPSTTPEERLATAEALLASLARSRAKAASAPHRPATGPAKGRSPRAPQSGKGTGMRPEDNQAADSPNIAIHGHQMDVGEALRTHVTDKLMGVAEKYLGAEDMTARFSRTGHGGFSCSVRVHAGKNLFFDGSAEAAEAPIAFNEALEHVAKQLRRRKRELREDKPVNPDKQGLV